MAWCDIEPGTSPAVVAIGAGRAEYDLCRQIPGARFGDDSLWRFPLTWPGYACMRTIWARHPLQLYPELAGWAEAKWAEVLERYRLRAALDADEPLQQKLISMDAAIPPELRMDGVQRGAVQWLLRWRRDIYGDPRGNGKTIPLIHSLRILNETEEACPALIVCPDSAPLSWQRKLGTWAPELRTVVIAGSAAKRAAAIGKLHDGEADVGIIVWQNVRYHTRLAAYPGQAFVCCDAHGGSTHKSAGLCERHLKDFNYPEGDRQHPDGSTWLRTVIPDEAHRMADAKSKQTRALWWLMQHCETTWPTTGTLQVNDVGNIWPILHGLDPLAFPVRSKYLDLFAVQQPAFAGRGKVILDLRPDTEATFRLAVEPLFRRIPAEIARPDDARPAEPEFRYPQMTPKQERVYAAIAQHGIAEVDDRDMVTETGITAFTRLCQLAGSNIVITEGEDPLGFSVPGGVVERALPSHKISDLLEFLDAEPGKWIIGVNSPSLAGLAERKLAEADIASVHILGGMNYQAKDAAVLAFERGDVRVIFVNEAGKESIDLPSADGIVWMEPNPSFVYREQLTGRGDRRGRGTAMRQVWMLTPGTVDIRLYELGLAKGDKHERVVQDAATLRWMMDVQPGEINGNEERAMA